MSFFCIGRLLCETPRSLSPTRARRSTQNAKEVCKFYTPSSLMPIAGWRVGDIDVDDGKVWLRTADHHLFIVIDPRSLTIDARTERRSPITA
jgi:hypothetical protein